MKKKNIVSALCGGVVLAVMIFLLVMCFGPPSNKDLILTLDSTREEAYFISEDPVQLGDGVKLLFVAYDPEVEQVQLCLRTDKEMELGQGFDFTVDGAPGQNTTWLFYQKSWYKYAMIYVIVPQGQSFSFTYQGKTYSY